MSSPASKSRPPESSIKETIISMVISLAMALVAKSYVVEAFVIPTGSMAPTLLGKHMLFTSPSSGYTWTVNPWYMRPGADNVPDPIQGNGGAHDPMVTDPMSTSRVNPWFAGQLLRNRQYGYTPPPTQKLIRAGDRILVQKYLYELFPPKRYDVVVFKNPEDARENFIKRLIGLPNEQVWLADGDVFARRRVSDQPESRPLNDGWEVQRKPDRVQESLWRPIYSSEYAPVGYASGQATWFKHPWSGTGIETSDAREFSIAGAEPVTLLWNTTDWPITNWVPYNDIGNPAGGSEAQRRPYYPIGDLRLRAGIRPESQGLAVTPMITAVGHQFRADIRPASPGSDDYSIRLERRPAPAAVQSDQPWELMAETILDRAVFQPGRTTEVALWHVDQALSLWIDGRKVATATYELTPPERLKLVTGEDVTTPNLPARFLDIRFHADRYSRHVVEAQWTSAGAPATLMRVGLDHDVYYEPATYQASVLANTPALGTHPDNLASLNGDQFFVCGDNSPSSKDGRLWDRVDPWVAAEIDPTMGVVPRKLMLGKAFYVYFPAPFSLEKAGSGGIGKYVLVPDIGRMRFIK